MPNPTEKYFYHWIADRLSFCDHPRSGLKFLNIWGHQSLVDVLHGSTNLTDEFEPCAVVTNVGLY